MQFFILPLQARALHGELGNAGAKCFIAAACGNIVGVGSHESRDTSVSKPTLTELASLELGPRCAMNPTTQAMAEQGNVH